MTVNSPLAKTSLLRVCSAAIALATAILVGGCASYSDGRSPELLVRRAPPPVRVAPGFALAAAERTAACHEGDFALAGVGDSMAPFYGSGTAVVVHPTSYFLLQPGMPVVYQSRRGESIAHMLVARTEAGWVVAGINNSEPDDEYVTPENLVGVITSAYAADPSPAPADRRMAWNEPSTPSTDLLH